VAKVIVVEVEWSTRVTPYYFLQLALAYKCMLFRVPSSDFNPC